MIDLKCDSRYSVRSHCTLPFTLQENAFATLYTLAFKKSVFTHSLFHFEVERRPPVAHFYGLFH